MKQTDGRRGEIVQRINSLSNEEHNDDTLARLSKLGAEVVGDVVKYEDVYRLCYIRGPEGLLIGLAQELR